MGSQIASAPVTRWEDILSAKMLRINVLLAVASLTSATPSHIGAGVAGINAGLGLGAGLGVAGGVGVGAGGVNNGAYANGGYAYGIHDTQCQTFYDTKIDPACHTEQDQVCHTEFDTVVDTTYVEDCQDIVTEQCHQVSQQVHHSSGVVGHDSQVLPGSYGGHPIGKREAEPSYGAIGGHTTGPQCHANTERQCQQRPVQNARQIPR